MFPKQSLLSAFSLLAGLAQAQDTTIIDASAGTLTSAAATPVSSGAGSSIVISYYNDWAEIRTHLWGSVITANPTMTAIRIECGPELPLDECGYGAGGNLTIENESTHILSFTISEDFTYVGECVAHATDSVVCDNSFAGLDPTVDTNMAVLMPMTIVAGLDKLVSATATASSTKSSSASAGASKTTSAKKTASTPSTATGSVPSSNAGRVQVWSAIGLLSVAAIMMSL